MKKIGVFLYFLLWSCSSYAQQYYDLRLEEDQIVYAATTLTNDYILLAGTSGNISSRETSAWLCLVNSDGNLIAQYHYHIPGYSLRFRFVQMEGLNTASLAAEMTSLSSFKTRAALLKVGLNQPQNPVLLQMQLWGDSTDNLMINGFCKDQQTGSYLMFGEDLSSTDAFILSSSDRVTFQRPGQQMMYDLVSRPDGLGWVALMSEWQSGALGSAVYLDYQFKEVYAHPFPEGVYELKSLEWRNDSVWYAVGARKFCLDAPSGLRPKDVVLLTGNKNSGIEVLTCLGSVNQNDTPGGMAFDFNRHQLLMSWTPAYRIHIPQSQGYSRNQIPLCLTDTIGNVLNQYMAGAEAYYEIHVLKRPVYGTDGKSWLLAGSRYDIWNPSTGTDVFWVVQNQETPMNQPWPEKDTYMVYPNPIDMNNRVLKVNHIQGSFSISTLDGKSIQTGEIQAEIPLEINTPGIYILNLIQKDSSVMQLKLWLME